MTIRMGELLASHNDDFRVEPTRKRIRAVLAGRVALDSRRALLVWPPIGPVPTYAVPVEDILLPDQVFPSQNALPSPADDELAGMVVLRFSNFDAWLEDDDQILGHPRDPFHRVDVRATSQRIQLSLDGQVLADTVRGRLLYETGLPTRYYVPRADILVPLLPTRTHTICPYKGEASYWSFTLGGDAYTDQLWSYERPLADSGVPAGYVAFYDERFELTVHPPID